MKKYKICVYAICKNEEQFVERWVKSMSEADIIVVTDTGSTDKTVEKLRELGVRVYTEKIEPWRFDTARNVSLSHVPEDADICVSVDLDEIFNPGWREKLEFAWNPAYTRAKYMFTWSYKPDGTPNKQFPMEKIHRRSGFKWVRPVHEILEYNGADKDMTVFVNGLVLNHYSDLAKPRSQYLPLLELAAKENSSDDRIMFWLGREYMYNKQHDLAIKTLKRHLAMPSAVWNEERSASMRFIAACFEAKGDRAETRMWLYKAIAECPDIREPYVKMAELGCAEKNWALVYAMAIKGLEITVKSNSYLTEPESWGSALYSYASIAAYYLDLISEAESYAEQAYKYNENDARLKNNLELIRSKLREVQQYGKI